MSKEFTYTIRSDSKPSSADPYNFTLKLANLPTHYKLFDVEVIGCFITDNPTTKVRINQYAEIQCDNVNIYGSYDTRNTVSKVLASNIAQFSSNSIIKYRIENFNNRDINFRVVDSSNTLLSSIHAFIIVLRLKGVEE